VADRCSKSARTNPSLPAFLSAALLAACGGTEPVVPGDDHEPKRIELSVSTLSVWIGQGDTVQVRVFDAGGKGVPKPPIRWASEEPAIAAVDPSGVITGIAEGRTRVTATSGALSASVAVDVLGVASVELTGPQTVLVNQLVVLEVTARDAGGRVITDPPVPTFSSSDPSVLGVSGSNAVRGFRRGNATVSVRIANASAAIDLEVRARLGIRPPYPVMRMSVGETLELSAAYLDVNGGELPERPAVSWRSNNPERVMVSSDGRVTATAAAIARIHAAAAQDTTFADVDVSDFRPGQLTTVRYAHAGKGMGPIRFVPSIGDPVTLNYGESADQVIPPGSLDVRTEGMPGNGSESGIRAQIRDGDHLTVYAMAWGPSQGFLSTAWNRTQNVPADLGRVRLVQSSDFSTYYLRPRGERPAGLPDDCYFDPGNVQWAWSTLAPGDFDIILTTKTGLTWGGSPVELARVPFEVQGGRATTMVLTGSSAADASVLTFIEP
jgi:hypothetical protein